MVCLLPLLGCDIWTGLLGGEGLACEQQQNCPPELLCVLGRCRRQPPDAAGTDRRTSDRDSHADRSVADHTTTDLIGRDRQPGDTEIRLPDAAIAEDGRVPDRGSADQSAPDAGITDAKRADSTAADTTSHPVDAATTDRHAALDVDGHDTLDLCALHSAQCGFILVDGSVIHCGPCPVDQICADQPANLCVTPPAACTVRNAECDYVAEEDGGWAYCGSCPIGQSCGACADPTSGCPSNRCGQPSACGLAECGFGDNGTHCGECPLGLDCSEDRRCVAMTRPLQWGPPQTWTAMPAEHGAYFNGRLHGEGGQGWYYLESGKWNGNGLLSDLPAAELARERFGNFPIVYDATTERALPDYTALTADGCSMCDTCGGHLGWFGHVFVRRDGLEMFFSSSVPCADWWDNEIFLSFRTDTQSSWSSPRLLDTTTVAKREPVSRDGLDDSVYNPVLLPDNRTLLFNKSNQMAVARRPGPVPGDTAFELIRLLDLDEGIVAVHPLELSCEGTHLIFQTTSSTNEEQTLIAKILAYEPFALGAARLYTGVTDINGRIDESSDCSLVLDGMKQVGIKFRRRIW